MKSVVKPAANTRQFEAIGTHWEIESHLTDHQYTQVRTIIDTYDQQFSRFRNDSLVWQMSQKAGTYQFQYGKELFKLYGSMYEQTGGLVTPLIGKTLETMGYDSNYSLVADSSLYKPQPIQDVLTYSGDQITVHQPALLDFGAAGKGHLVDIVSRYIENKTAGAYCVDAGGDMYSNALQRVGLEDPTKTGKVIGFADITNASICGSAGNRRSWGRYHHIVNPDTLEPTSGVVAVWVVAKTALLADGIATCLFFVDPEQLTDHYSFEYVMVMQDGSARISDNFPGRLFS